MVTSWSIYPKNSNHIEEWNLPLVEEKLTLFEGINARSDLTDTDIQTARFMLERGKRPIFSVTYLLKRTVGLQLVESWISMLHAKRS